MSQQKIQKIKQFLERNRIEQAQRRGQLAQIEQQIQNDYGCNDVAQAEEYRLQLLTEADRLDAEVTEGLRTIEEELGWT